MISSYRNVIYVHHHSILRLFHSQVTMSVTLVFLTLVGKQAYEQNINAEIQTNWSCK